MRSGISDDLSRLLSQHDENAERKALNQLEQAALFRELRKLIREDGLRRRRASQDSTHGGSEGQDGSGESPEPQPGHRDSRHQAALAVTGKASYHLLEQSAIERIAADRTLPDRVRRTADMELQAIQDGGDVNPAYGRVILAKDTITADDTPERSGPLSAEEFDELAKEAKERVDQDRERRGSRGGPSRTSRSGHRSLRAFLLTWGDLDGWSRYYNPSEIVAQLKQSDWEMFERVLAETISFADEVRALRNVRVPPAQYKRTSYAYCARESIVGDRLVCQPSVVHEVVDGRPVFADSAQAGPAPGSQGSRSSGCPGVRCPVHRRSRR